MTLMTVRGDDLRRGSVIGPRRFLGMAFTLHAAPKAFDMSATNVVTELMTIALSPPPGQNLGHTTTSLHDVSRQWRMTSPVGKTGVVVGGGAVARRAGMLVANRLAAVPVAVAAQPALLTRIASVLCLPAAQYLGGLLLAAVWAKATPLQNVVHRRLEGPKQPRALPATADHPEPIGLTRNAAPRSWALVATALFISVLLSLWLLRTLWLLRMRTARAVSKAQEAAPCESIDRLEMSARGVQRELVTGEVPAVAPTPAQQDDTDDHQDTTAALSTATASADATAIADATIDVTSLSATAARALWRERDAKRGQTGSAPAPARLSCSEPLQARFDEEAALVQHTRSVQHCWLAEAEAMAREDLDDSPPQTPEAVPRKPHTIPLPSSPALSEYTEGDLSRAPTFETSGMSTPVSVLDGPGGTSPTSVLEALTPTVPAAPNRQASRASRKMRSGREYLKRLSGRSPYSSPLDDEGAVTVAASAGPTTTRCNGFSSHTARLRQPSPRMPCGTHV